MSTTESKAERGDFSGPVALFRSAGFWLVIACVGMVGFYWIGLSSLWEAWSQPEYSHGYLIPLIALYLFILKSKDLPPREDEADTSYPIGIIVFLVGLFLGLFGNLASIPDINSYGLIVCIGGFVLVCTGPYRGLYLWAPVAYLIFMLPLPNFIYWPLSIKLQLMSSEIGVDLIRLIGVPVYLAGNVIDLGDYKLQVAEACSGLRYLFPLLSFGFLFAIIYKGPIWHKLILFLSTIPITIFMNSTRIAAIGALVNWHGIAQAEGFLHFFEGWVIFLACLIVLYSEAMLLQKLIPDRSSVQDMLEFDWPTFGNQFRVVGKMAASRSLILSSSLVIFSAAIWHMLPAREPTVPDRASLVSFPLNLESWKGQRSTLEPAVEAVLAADDYLVADYRSDDVSASVNLFIAYYKSQTEGSGMHSPEVCLPTGGWEVSAWAPTEIALRTVSGNRLSVNRAVIQKGLNKQLVYYWFEQRGRSITNDYVVKGFSVVDSIFRGRTDGALVRIVTPIAQGEADADADARLEEFLASVLQILPSYVPS